MHLICTRCIKHFLKIMGHTYVLYYSFVLFLLDIVLSVLLRCTESDCPFGIFKIFFQINFSRFSINEGYWKNKMRSRKILHRCSDYMRGLSPNFYLNISKDMPCHISIHQSKIQNSANKGNNKLPNSEQSYKGKVKTHKYLNRQNQSTTGKLWNP